MKSRWTIPCLDSGCGLKSVDVDHKRGLTCPSPIWIEPENPFLDRKHLRGCPRLSCHGHFLPAASQNVSFHVRHQYKWILRGEIMTPFRWKPVVSIQASQKQCAKFCIYSRPFFWDYGKKFFRCLLVGHILRRKTGKLPCLDTRFLGGHQNIAGF